MDGVVEDVTEIILNLKKLVLKNHSENNQVLHLRADKEGEVYASMIDKNSEVEIINPDLLIATLAEGEVPVAQGFQIHWTYGVLWCL